jgi:MSHA biogenesis protein MshP
MYLNAVVAVRGFGTRQAGSALTMALWLIVIGSLLVLVLLQFRQQSSSALVYQVQGQRCYALAKSQLELALVQLFPLGSTAASCAVVTTSRSWSQDDWQGCHSTLSCQQISVDGSQSFRLTSTATCGSGELVSSRTVTLEAGL